MKLAILGTIAPAEGIRPYLPDGVTTVLYRVSVNPRDGFDSFTNELLLYASHPGMREIVAEYVPNENRDARFLQEDAINRRLVDQADGVVVFLIGDLLSERALAYAKERGKLHRAVHPLKPEHKKIDYEKTLGNLKMIMADACLDESGLGRLIGRSTRNVWAILNGETRPTLKTLRSIADKLNREVWEVVAVP